MLTYKYFTLKAHVKSRSEMINELFILDARFEKIGISKNELLKTAYIHF